MGRRVQLIWYKKNWYHPNFFRRSKLCVKQAKYTCQDCGKKRGEEYTANTGRIDKVVIQASHVNHDPWNGKAALRARCKQCHMRYDGPIHAEKARRTHYRKKHEKAVASGQLELWINQHTQKPKRRKQTA